MEQIRVGRVLRTSNRMFAVGCPTVQADLPSFGSLVRAAGRTPDTTVYGLVYDVVVQDDLFVRRFVIADPPEEVVRDQRDNRQVPIEVSVLAVGYQKGTDIFHRIPPQPPAPMDLLYRCGPEEVVSFTRRLDYFRLILGSPEVPADDLLAASIRQAAACRPSNEREQFLVEAGRELARILSGDPLRLDGLLRHIRPEEVER